MRPLDGKALAALGGNRIDAQLAAIAEEILQILQREESKPEPVEELAPVRQVPAPPADFTGRETELARIKAACLASRDSALFLGAFGPSGIGKTSLLLKLAAELADDYPDAQLYFDFHGDDVTSVPAASAMAHVVRSLSPAEPLPSTPADLARAFRMALQGKRALLMLDNVTAREQVADLRPPGSSALMISSRSAPFPLPGLLSISLGELAPGEARELLQGIVPQRPAEAARIADQISGHPLALRLAGGALLDRPDLSPSDYSQRLASTSERLGLVEASLKLSYQVLDKDMQSLWVTLSVFPGFFDAAAATAVLDLPPDRAQAVLAELTKSCLVELDDGRYRLHDLARQFAETQLGKKAKYATQLRHAAHYLEVARNADELYLEGGESLQQGLRLFDREWPNIKAGQAWAAENARENKTPAELCSAFPDAAVFVLELRQPPRDQICWLEAALAAARFLKDRYAEARHLGNLGLAYTDLGEPKRAVELHQAYLALSRELKDRWAESYAHGYLGLAYEALGRSRTAIKSYEQQLAIAREIGDRRGEGNALGNLGEAYESLGDIERAIQLYEQSLEIDREIKDPQGEVTDLSNLGFAYHSLGQSSRAFDLFAKAIDLAREMGYRRGEAEVSWNYGIACEKLGDLEHAIPHMQVLVDYEREIGHADAEADAELVEELRARLTAKPPSAKAAVPTTRRRRADS
jgi:tetratricopeptide (TPR) repeat protein